MDQRRLGVAAFLLALGALAWPAGGRPATTLPNGLKTFVRQNARPAKRVSLRLAVKAGSLDEADDQQGLAHFIEHMAFNGSAHFKPGELVSYFESVGARLGPHVNAYTSFDETVYMLDLPSDKPDIVAKGLTALADFAGGLTLDPTEVDKERGVVIEEWRGGLGAGSRIRDKQFPVLFYQSRYAERLPIGKPEIIRNAPAARLRAFYDTWYRPERMAVIAVGDIDPQQIEAAIASAFGALKAERPPRRCPTPPCRFTSSRSSASSPIPRSRSRTCRSCASARPKRSAGRRLPPRAGAAARRAHVQRTPGGARAEARREVSGRRRVGRRAWPDVSTFSIGAAVPDGKLEDGIAAIAIETRRVREHGFTEPEFDRAKKWMAAFYERAYTERDKTESGSFAQEYLRNTSSSTSRARASPTNISS